jgi:hypothetical protein
VQYAESEQIDVLNPVYQNEIETLVGLLEKYGHEIEMYTVEQGEKRDKRQ